jgi:hypothetical protein
MIRHNSPKPANLFQNSFPSRTCRRRKSQSCFGSATARKHNQWGGRGKGTAGAADSVGCCSAFGGRCSSSSNGSRQEISVCGADFPGWWAQAYFTPHERERPSSQKSRANKVKVKVKVRGPNYRAQAVGYRVSPGKGAYLS